MFEKEAKEIIEQAKIETLKHARAEEDDEDYEEGVQDKRKNNKDDKVSTPKSLKKPKGSISGQAYVMAKRAEVLAKRKTQDNEQGI